MAAEQIDVLVVGGASAGWAAAFAAHEAGAGRVVVVEKAPRDQAGGNCRFSGMGFRFLHEGTEDLLELLPEAERDADRDSVVLPYTAEKFMADLKRVTQDRIDPEIAATLVQDSREAIDWMTSLGHKWKLFHPLKVDGRVHYNAGKPIMPMEGGQGLVEHWIKIGEAAGIDFRCNSRLSAIYGNYRGVHGARITGPDGDYDVEARSIIIASGGFQASASARARHLSAGADVMKVRGSRHNTGEVLDMVVELGAKTSGQWQGAHASPIDFHSSDMEVAHGVNRYGYTYGVSVNKEGQRFFDEGEAHRAYTYAKTGWAVLRQPGGMAYQIYDQVGLTLIPSDYLGASPIEADTIRGLADKINMDASTLESTLAEYNASCTSSVEFDPAKEDGRGTVGLAQKKTNWAVPIEQGPYVAYEVTGGITFTFGGLAVDRSARVLNTNGDPIEGLYANGDVAGLFYHNYPSCSGMTRNVVFGGRAGVDAATR